VVFDIDRPSSATYNDRDDTSPTNSDHENFEADSSDLVSSSEEAIAKKMKFRRKKANLAILRARISQVCREVLTRLEPVNPIIHQFTEKNRGIKKYESCRIIAYYLFLFTQWLFVRHLYSDLYLLFIRDSSEYASYDSIKIILPCFQPLFYNKFIVE